MYFHIYNRGTRKHNIFENNKDRVRFLFVVFLFQFDIKIKNISKTLKKIESVGDLSFMLTNLKDLQPRGLHCKKLVTIHSFCLMPNHFHLILEDDFNNKSDYLMRVLDSYTKYFNIKYELTGHLFEGPYKAKSVGDDIYLLALSAYIHNNPYKLKSSNHIKNLEKFEWSSYTDYVNKNRWNNFIETSMILSFFSDQKDYAKFVTLQPRGLQGET